MAFRIIIETIPAWEQRYATVGDWFTDDQGHVHIRVSDMGNWRYEAAVGVHELVEYLLCRSDGVKQGDVDNFDLEFESRRHEGDVSEPGDDPRSPYTTQHCLATGIERLLIALLGATWSDYEATVDAL